MTTKVFPFASRLLVATDPPEEFGAGLVRPDTARDDRPESGIVRAVGEQVPADWIGRHIVFPPYAGSDYKRDGEPMKMLDISEVFGVLRAEA